MGRVRTSVAKTLAEVEAESPAWRHGCDCHTCRILNGKPEPRISPRVTALFEWLFPL